VAPIRAKSLRALDKPVAVAQVATELTGDYVHDIVPMYMEDIMLRNKHLRLDQSKIDRARQILKAKTDTETLHAALDALIEAHRMRSRRRNLIRRMLRLRKSLGKIRGDTAEWIRQARDERQSGNEPRH
jgi:Bacterial antitoxin of type II TA system, VapB